MMPSKGDVLYSLREGIFPYSKYEAKPSLGHLFLGPSYIDPMNPPINYQIKSSPNSPPTLPNQYEKDQPKVQTPLGHSNYHKITKPLNGIAKNQNHQNIDKPPQQYKQDGLTSSRANYLNTIPRQKTIHNRLYISK